MTRLLAVVGCALVVVVATTGPAMGFSGPWDSAHEPTTLSNPGVGVEQSGRRFFVYLGYELTCPQGQPVPYTVVFSDPTGSASVTVAEPCPGTWQPVSTSGEVAAFVNAQNRRRERAHEPGAPEKELTMASVTFSPLRSTPFVWEVVGALGVIARQAMTATVKPTHEIERNAEPDAFFNTCIDGPYEIFSKNGGELYCTAPAETSYGAGGWPNPPEVVTPPPKPKPEPKPKPKARYLSLNAKSAPVWTNEAVFYGFGYNPKPLRAHCKSQRAGTFLCDVAWRHKENAFSGFVEMRSVNIYNGHFSFRVNVIRTNLHTHKRVRFVGDETNAWTNG